MKNKSKLELEIRCCAENGPHERSHPLQIRTIDWDTLGKHVSYNCCMTKLCSKVNGLESLSIIYGQISTMLH